MARPRKSRTLGLWMNGERVGDWHVPARGSQEFRYAPSWLESRHVRPISLSLPLRPPGEPYRDKVESFFENLLPDNRSIRERIQRRFQTRSLGAFDLLAEVGRDCIGALQLLPEDQEPGDIRRITGEPLTRLGVAKLLEGSLSSTGFQSGELADDFRISIAGAQEKTALLWHRETWHRPTGTTPTTHLIKLPIGSLPHGIDLSTSVENEWLCAEILKAYGIPVAPCWIETFGGFKTLVVERFDRQLAADRSWWIRLPQEDFCQATGTPPGLKYENEGGPGIRRIMDLLLGSENAGEDRQDFLRTQFVFWLLAAIDGHAKNFSLFLRPGSSYRLTPRYDVLSAHPIVGRGRGKLAKQKIKMSMGVWGRNRHYRWTEIKVRHWIKTARQCGFSGMQKIIDDLCDRTPGVLDSVRGRIPRDFPMSLADSILGGVAATAESAVPRD